MATLCMLEADQSRSSSDNNDRSKSNDGRGRSQYKGPKKKLFYKYCKKKSHMIEDCWKLQNKEKRKNKSDGKASVASAGENSRSDCLVVFAGCVAGHDEWILDSACSFHIYTNRDWFSSYESLQNGDFISALTEIGSDQDP